MIVASLFQTCECGATLHWWKSFETYRWVVQHGDESREARREFDNLSYVDEAVGTNAEITDHAAWEWVAEVHLYQANRAAVG